MKIYPKTRDGSPVMREQMRPVFVVDALSELQGATSGTVTLPISIDWTPAKVYDLSDEHRTRTLYATVLQEARSERDLKDLLNHERLVTLWRQLRLPLSVRSAWEEHHQELLHAR